MRTVSFILCVGVWGALGLAEVNAATTAYAVVRSFTNNPDGSTPNASLILSGGTLYGTTFNGGSFSNGTVFKLNTNGTGATVLHSFAGVAGDGANPNAGLVLSGSTLYGTAVLGGDSGQGVLFGINTNGTGFTNIFSFSSTVGNSPYSGLALAGSTLYGTTHSGAGSGLGAVYAINTDGTGFTNLYSFTGSSDGSRPRAGLVLSGGTLYGTTDKGGNSGLGTIFKVGTNGAGFASLHSFAIADGSNAIGALMLLGSTLYGATSAGGSLGHGTLFRINTDGTGYANLHSFAIAADGGNPYGTLVSVGSALYGTTSSGGSSNNGTLFQVNTNGGGFFTLHNFGGSPDGANSYAGLTLSASTLYGTTAAGGRPQGYGTVFKFAIGLLDMQLVGNRVVLSWPATNYTLQMAPNVTGVFTNVPGATSPYTNTASGPQAFFRLLAN